MKNALHLLVFIDEKALLVMANTRPDSSMYMDSLAEHKRTAMQISNLLHTCQVDMEDIHDFFPRYGRYWSPSSSHKKRV